MKDEFILRNLKIDLGISATQYDDFLKNLIVLAKESIEQEGITLEDTKADNMLIVMYSAWLYRKRKESDNAMPRMLRWQLNNRVITEKGRGE